MQQTRLDRMIGWLSPERALRRAVVRAAMESLSFAGASQDRRNEGWVTIGNSADAESAMALKPLRDRARDLVRNNPYAARAIEVKESTTVGTGIVADVRNQRLKTVWDAFIDAADADRKLDLYGIQGLTERCRMESGECLIQRVPSSITRGGVAFRLRVLEPDHIDTSRDGRSANGNTIRHGIEYDASQTPVGYWLFPEHPGSHTTFGQTARLGMVSVRVDARDVIHVFRKIRAGQTRGVTDFAPIVVRLRGLDDYDDAELMRKKIEACMAVFVTTSNDTLSSSVGRVSTDAKGRLESIFPGLVKYLAPGENVTTAEPKASGGYAEFQTIGLRAIAAGVGIPYELMTGDLSNVNFSSARVGLVDFRRRIERDQWLMHVPQVCARIWRWFVADASAIHGTNPNAKADWTPPRFELVDPAKETQADLEAVLSGFETWDEIVKRRGWNPADQLDVIERWQRSLSDRGIVVKSDFRNEVNSSAQAPDSDPDDTPEDDVAEEEAA